MSANPSRQEWVYPPLYPRVSFMTTFIWRQMSLCSLLLASLSRMAPGPSPACCPGLGRLSSAWQAAGGSSMRRRKLNYRSCCPLCKQDKSQWYGQLHLNTTHVYNGRSGRPGSNCTIRDDKLAAEIVFAICCPVYHSYVVLMYLF